MIITDVPSAEMIKYASNAFLATKISFANAVANLCELAGADVAQVDAREWASTRASARPSWPAGLGYGGSCFPKDTESLIHTASTLGLRLAPAPGGGGRSTAAAPSTSCEAIGKVLGPLDGKIVALLGVAFKPNTDDMREAKSIEVAPSWCAWAPPSAPMIRWPWTTRDACCRPR